MHTNTHAEREREREKERERERERVAREAEQKLSGAEKQVRDDVIEEMIRRDTAPDRFHET